MGILLRLILLALGYGLGLIQTGYIYGRINGIDIRKKGSGNAGTTNALRVLGKKAGLIVFLGDFCKAFIPCLIIRLVFNHIMPEYMYIMLLYLGIGAVLGHDFPCYLGFKGGKGIATTAGAIIATLEWKIILPCFIGFVLIVAITRYVSVGSIFAVVSMLVFYIIFGSFDMLFLNEYVKEFPQLVECYIILGIFAFIAVYKHKANIIRLIHHEENKLWGNKKKANNESEA